MEPVWRYVKDKRGCHHWWADWQALWEATAARLTHMKARLHQTTRSSIAIVQTFAHPRRRKRR